MDIHRLIKMANDIASFFEPQPDPSKRLRGIADHLKNFWEPRMRRQLLEYAQQDGAGLTESVRQALRVHEHELAPQGRGAPTA
jgi:formate dehydrogenase subunit delta